MNVNYKYFLFHSNLMGYDCYKDGKKIPKYILFWRRYLSSKIKAGLTDIELRKRK